MEEIMVEKGLNQIINLHVVEVIISSSQVLGNTNGKSSIAPVESSRLESGISSSDLPVPLPHGGEILMTPISPTKVEPISGEKQVPIQRKDQASLFGNILLSKSSFAPITNSSCWEKREFQIFVPDPLVDHSISNLNLTLVGKFMGSRPTINQIKLLVRKTWHLRGHVDIAVMQRGFLSFIFTCQEDRDMVLCGGSLSIGK